MPLWFPASVGKNPAWVWGVFLALLQHIHQFCRHLYVARRVFLGSKTNFGFGADMVNPPSEVDILPRGIHDFLLPASRPEEKLIASGLFLVHRCEEFLEFHGFVRDSGFFLVLRQVSNERESNLDSVCLQKHEN